MAMEIGNMSSTELKALGFDLTSQMSNLQTNLNVVLKQIEVKVKEENFAKRYDIMKEVNKKEKENKKKVKDDK